MYHAGQPYTIRHLLGPLAAMATPRLPAILSEGINKEPALSLSNLLGTGVTTDHGI